DLAVALASVAAGLQWNKASADSLGFMSALLTVQNLMGIATDTVTIVLADSLRLTPPDTAASPPFGGDALATSPIAIGIPSVLVVAASSTPSPALTLTPLTPGIAAAEASVQAAALAVQRERRSTFLWRALSAGVEFGDPTGAEPGLLPTFGIVLPLPFFNRNKGPIAEAEAEQRRASAQLAVVRLEARQRLVEGLREREALR